MAGSPNIFSTHAMPASSTTVPTEEYRERMRRKVDEADVASLDTQEVHLNVSRQTAADLIEAFNQLNQMNPWYRGIARRLRDLSIQVSDALDQTGHDGRDKVVREKD